MYIVHKYLLSHPLGMVSLKVLLGDSYKDIVPF